MTNGEQLAITEENEVPCRMPRGPIRLIMNRSIHSFRILINNQH